MNVRIQPMANRSRRWPPLLVFWLGGLAGVLVDVDHPAAYLTGLPREDYRFLHGTFFVLAIAVGCGAVSYLRGRADRVVLK